MKILRTLGVCTVGIVALLSIAVMSNFIMGLNIPALSGVSQPVRNIAAQATSGGAEKVETGIDWSALPAGDETLPLPFYYDKLPSDQKAIYDVLLDGMYSMTPDIEIPECDDLDRLKQTFEFVMYDHPEIFWVDNAFTYDYYPNGRIHTFHPTYPIDQANRDEKQAAIDSTVGDIIAKIPQDAGAYEKAKIVYSSIAKMVEYDVNSIDSQNIVSSLINHVSACAGYSKAFQYIMGKLDVPCIYVSGQADGGAGIENHAWNIVCIDGTLASVDITWGDGMRSDSATGLQYDYTYLCLPDDLLMRDHAPTYPDIVPQCTSYDYLYTKLVGSYWDAYDEQSVRNRIYSGFVDGDEALYLQFGGDDAYMQTVNALSSTNMAFECAYGAAAANGTQLGSDTCSIYRSDATRTVIIAYDINGNGIIEQR